MDVCVFAASSRLPAPPYFDAARRLGATLAGAGFAIRYGGGAVGLMGALADAALAAGGRVTGIIPRFMVDLEWSHPGVTALDVVETMAERKTKLMDGSAAIVALPGGVGTLEELLEAITLKQLGIYRGPILLVNTLGFYDRLAALLHHCVEEGFLGGHHRTLWTLVDEPEAIPAAIRDAAPLDPDVIKTAQL